MISEASGVAPRPAVGGVDLAMAGLLAGSIVALVAVARAWSGPLVEVPAIHLEARYLPYYALLSLARGVTAYGVSLAFTLVYGYAMARMAGAERILLPVLDILQSIPVLGFLPGLVLGIVGLFPHRNLGLEIACVLMIFTGQVWNMTLSFYSSLKTVPRELVEVARLSGMSWLERFLRLDLSHAATGLIWNSMMSMAGGWFFLMISEAFVLGKRDYRLPGLGSYMSVAVERHDGRAQLLGVLAMLGLIVLLDQVVWRPLMAWSQKFGETGSGSTSGSWLWDRIRGWRGWRGWRGGRGGHGGTGGGGIGRWWRRRAERRPLPSGSAAPNPARAGVAGQAGRWGKWILGAAIGLGVVVGGWQYAWLVSSLGWGDWAQLLKSTGATLLRVVGAVGLATLWAVPVGVWIGRDARWVRVLQPVIQMAASFPAPMIFPMVVGGLLAAGIGLGWGAVVLLLLGAQWYILFNVIGGSSAIPRELWEVSRLARFSWRQRWVGLVLPAVFPSLLTGWMTALGGAWNASIVAEYVVHDRQVLATTGLGAAISLATARGDYPVLAAAVGLMAVTVVGFNRLVWRPLGRRAHGQEPQEG